MEAVEFGVAISKNVIEPHWQWLSQKIYRRQHAVAVFELLDQPGIAYSKSLQHRTMSVDSIQSCWFLDYRIINKVHGFPRVPYDGMTAPVLA